MIDATRSLAAFRGVGYDKGRPVWIQAMWFAAMNLVFVKWWCPARFRPILLRWFGADIGHGVFIRHGVRVLWPWKLTVDNDCWIGEGVWLLNLEPITLERDVCLSQAAFLITGSHDRHSSSFEYDNGPIVIEAGGWIAARATILRGVTVGRNAVIGAGAVVSQDVPPESVIRR